MKILIIRLSSIGDIVLTTPAIRCLKQQIKESEIHFLTKKSYAAVLRFNPYIDKLHFWEKSDKKKIIIGLQLENFDYVIDLHHNFRTFSIKKQLKAKSYSFYKANVEKYLMVRLKWDKLPKQHIVDRYLATASELGIKNDNKYLDYFISESDKIEMSTYLAPENTKNYIAFVIGATYSTKRLPIEKMLEICELIERPIVLLGGREEAKDGEYLAQKIGGKVVNLCGHLRLNQSASVVQQAAKVISHDTGLMHIAAAFQKPILSVWGNTIPEFGMYPYLNKTQAAKSKMVQVRDLPCRPCSKIGFQKCPKKHFACMNLIDVNEIADWANEIDG
ncbi:MAG: glycosyltransferase family 9 protein [Chitinophagales bacterium]